MYRLNTNENIEVYVNNTSLIDSTDGITPETGVAYNDPTLTWHFTALDGTITATSVTGTTGGVHDWTHVGDAIYKIEIPATGGTVNNDTAGWGFFTGNSSGVIPWVGPRYELDSSGNKMVFTNANELDVNIQSINNVSLSGAGISGNEWGPA